MSAQFFGEYRCLARLGVGAWSEVVLAEHPDLGRVALKRLSPSGARDPEIVAAILAEASLVASIDHPHVVGVLDHGERDGLPYVAFELVDGADLADVVARATDAGRALALGEVAAIVLPLADALEHVHGLPGSPVHRDVSPSNVLVGVDGAVKLTDFGIARVEGRALRRTEDGVVRGTARYMAPEQVLGRTVDRRTDVYALGAIAYELVTGKPLVSRRRPSDVAVDVAEGPASRASFDAMPPAVAEILRRALAREPEERYATAAQLSSALSAVLPAQHGADLLRELMRSLAYEPFRKVGESENTREKFHESAVKSGAQASGQAATRQPPGGGATWLGRSASASLKERPDMAEDKGGSDLDVFEGLAKKSQRGSALPPPPASGPTSAGVPPSLASQSRAPARANTLAGVQAPESVPGRGSNVPPPVPSGTGSAAAAGLTGTATLGTPLPSISGAGIPSPSIRDSNPLPPPSSVAKVPPPPPPNSSRASGPPPLPAGADSNLPPPPPPPSTLVAAVPPPPISVGSQLGMPSNPTAVSSASPAAADAAEPKGDKPKVRGAGVDMDWEEDEESTHVFEKQKHGLTPSPKSIARPSSTPPPPSKVGAAAALLASSGSAAAPRSLAGVPAPPAVPAALPIPKTISRAAPETIPVASTARPRPTQIDDAVSAAPPPVIVQQASGSKLGVILGGLALVAVVALGVYLFMPRTGQLKIDLKAKSGQGVARAEIFVDGQKKCDTSPCVVTDLAPGPKAIKVIAPGAAVADVTESVEAGKEKPVFITIDDSGAAPTPPRPTETATPQPVAEKGTGFKMGGQSGAKVFVDGKEKGVLPVTLTDLPAGDHKIKIDGGDRYEPLEKSITVKANEVADLGETKLKVLKGRLTLELSTPGSAVVLTTTKAGKKVEKRIADAMWASPPVRIDIDTKDQWKLVATKKGMNDFEADVKFDDGEAEKTITINLESGAVAVTPPTPTPPTPGTGTLPTPPTPGTGKIPTPPTTSTPTPPETAAPVAAGMGTLNINSIPPSKAILDGRPLGTTPIMGQQVSAGSHSVTFIHPEKGKKSTTVTVKAGGKATAAVKFD